ncbi:MAG: methyl-accepting chemotaxis protein [Roseburia sp.]|nr:methyl-accepting chemotaxis protein [Roseburia sp.]
MKGKKTSVRTKLLTYIIPAVTFAFVVLVMIANSYSRSTLKEKTAALLEAETSVGVNSVHAWNNDLFATLNTASSAMKNLGMTNEEILEYEKSFYDKYADFPNGIYVTCDDGTVIDAAGWVPEGDAREGSWYVDGVSHATMAFGEPYVDSYTNSYVVTASRWIDRTDGTGMVVAADVTLNILSETVGSMEVEGGGDAFILDASSGIMLAHKDTTLVGQELNALEDAFYGNVLAEIQAGNLATASYASNDGDYMVSMENIEGTTWYLVTRALEDVIYQDVYKVSLILAVVGLSILAVIAFMLVLVINRITKPIQKLTDTIVTVTSGDFTADIEVKGRDELAVMAGSMQEFLSVMRETLGSIIDISDKIDEQAKGSNVISGELHESANGQAEAMDQMRQNLEELVDSIEVIADNATKLANVVAETSDAGGQALGNIEETMKEAAGGRASMQSVTESMEEMKNGMQVLEKSISDVGAAAVKIDEITAAIREIADETNLLALNASIEAARAGEAGRGFSVVATQIKKLAETSGEAADEISQLIESVTSLINVTVEQSYKSTEQINNSAELVFAASEQFNRIFESIESTNDIINVMIKSVYDASDVASNMAAITEEQSASAEEIEATAVSIQELSNTVLDNSANVQRDSTELASTAEVLKEHISKFTIEKEDEGFVEIQ